MSLGVDFASVDGNAPPDWRTAKREGISFAILRASFAMYSNARKLWTIAPDPTFSRDWSKVPVVKGAYMFPEPRALLKPHEQVEVFAKSVKAAGGLKRGVDLPPVLDIEFPGGLSKSRLSRKQAIQWMKDAAHAMADTFDVAPMLYTSARVWDGEDDDSLNADEDVATVIGLKDCPLWLARYPYTIRTKAVMNPPADRHPPVPKMWGAGNYWIWQYQGDALKVPGFTSTVDLNRFNVMKIGEKGERVKWVQLKIGTVPDGIFGPETQKKLIAFQKRKGLSTTGTVDVATFAALGWV
jgi:GH25 family lysozyme M1 (1,4-beta-N-acetylmuramidase)